MGNLCGSQRKERTEFHAPLVEPGSHLRSLSVFDPSGAPKSLFGGYPVLSEGVLPGVFRGHKTEHLGVGFESITGLYPSNPQWINQDNYGVFVPFGADEELSFYAVFDGHGTYGGTASAFAREKIVEYLEKTYERFREDPKAVLREAFLETNRQMTDESRLELFEFSGTTAVCVVLHKDKIICANVGDSRAVLGRVIHGTLEARDLSDDHKPTRNDERKRIRAVSDAKIDPTLRVWSKEGDYPGVAFTRSLGDTCADRLGCFGEPEFVEISATKEDGFIVLASDGVWEFMTSQRVVDLVAAIPDPGEAAKTLCKEAKRRWLSLEQRTDDITAIVIHLSLFHRLSELASANTTQ